MYVGQLWLICVLVGLVNALFEDQVGKFDWRHQYIGCPLQVHFDEWGRNERLLVSTRENVFASLSANTGHIVWRRIQEDAKGVVLPSVADEKTLYSVSDGGRVVRAWNKRNGALLWQTAIAEKTDPSSSLAIALTSNTVVVSSLGKLAAFSESGKVRWTETVEKSDWSKLIVDNDIVRHLSIVNGVFHVRDFSLSTGESVAVKAKSIKAVPKEKCVTMRNLFICADGDSLYIVDGIGSTLNDESKSIGFKIKELVVLDNNHLLVKGLTSALILHSSSDGFQESLSLIHGVDSAAMYSDTLVVISGKNLEVYDMKTSKRVFETTLTFDEENIAPVKAAYVSVKEAIELLIVGHDCRMEFLIIDISKASVVSEWVREEALALISSVEMVDLPLSELQQMIEDEFEEGGKSDVMSSFIRRLISQTSQIQKWLLKTINEIFTFSYMISTRTNSFSKLLHHVRSAAKSGNHSGEILERDFFNLRKIIVATTLDGVVFGLDSSDGSIVWRLWLGNHFAPLSNFIGKSEVPLFVQRSTAHYQLAGQASVAFKDSVSSFGILVFFNPITGKVVEKTMLSTSISRVDVLNFVIQEHIYPLVVVGGNNEISLHPNPSENLLAAAPPVYILIPEGSHISGAVINLSEKKMVRTWTADLHLAETEKIIAIKGKPRHQKMHSQGRVLIDRNVQYKYANPNLVAIATLDKIHQYLSIFLIDVVSGQMVHSARLAKATAPVHLVHCEHWIAYSYWSEKGRRTEIGVLELYEGSEQSNKDYFDSLSPTRTAPQVVTQSFIYAQGIQAMAVSETEKGLTTRSLLMALPMGGIHEVTRKLLDATRPLELTQEMREEMMIPYIPEIPIATEDMVNYNQTVHNVRGIKTASSGLESTSLMMAYGIDVFFTRLHPSGTFDILKDDFDHVLISIVLFGLIAGSIISKKLARNNALSAAWA
ncbi:hypothetical protein V3C99_011465 [Haemonchus contortus]|nr:Pyrrolo-quinoline quinone repeat and Protein of unknown function DUF1620 domain containing protein [Haemonchus contortus]